MFRIVGQILYRLVREVTCMIDIHIHIHPYSLLYLHAITTVQS